MACINGEQHRASRISRSTRGVPGSCGSEYHPRHSTARGAPTQAIKQSAVVIPGAAGRQRRENHSSEWQRTEDCLLGHPSREGVNGNVIYHECRFRAQQGAWRHIARRYARRHVLRLPVNQGRLSICSVSAATVETEVSRDPFLRRVLLAASLRRMFTERGENIRRCQKTPGGELLGGAFPKSAPRFSQGRQRPRKGAAPLAFFSISVRSYQASW